VCRYTQQITVEQLQLLINDLRPAYDANRREFAELCGFESGMDPDIVEQALAIKHRTYTADKRASLLGL
jgi:hypothetical protein